MKTLVRGLVGLLGVLALVMAIAFWVDPARPAAQLGLAPAGGLGLATLRADIGAFFAVAGGLSLAAAIRNQARLLTAPLLLVSLAILGRFATIALSGYTPDMAQPIIVEAILIAVLAAGRRFLPAG